MDGVPASISIDPNHQHHGPLHPQGHMTRNEVTTFLSQQEEEVTFNIGLQAFLYDFYLLSVCYYNFFFFLIVCVLCGDLLCGGLRLCGGLSDYCQS
jgi:hypothetical protein